LVIRICLGFVFCDLVLLCFARLISLEFIE